MSNPPFPTDAASEADGPPRRSGLRLSEADIIASARLDVLGDGTLREALSGVPDGNPEGATAHDAPQLADRFVNGGAAPLPSDGFDGGLPPAPVRDPSEWIEPAHSPPPASARPAGVPLQDFLPLDFAPVHFEPAPGVYGDAASRSGLAQLGLRQPLIGAPPTVEVSPILSALDAAERLAEETGSPAQAFDANGSRTHEFGSPMPATDGGGFDARPHSAYLADTFPADADTGRGASNFADPGETADVTPQPPGVQHPARDEATPISDALDTAAKLVAEASVTAEALEGLKRLLERRLPTSDFGPLPNPSEPRRPHPALPSPSEPPREHPALPSPFEPPRAHPALASPSEPPRAHRASPSPSEPQRAQPASPSPSESPRAHPVSPPPIPVQSPVEPAPVARAEPVPVAPAEPLPAPATPVKASLPALPTRPRRSQGIDVHGFMAGFGLSLAVGVLLYLFMTTG